MVVNAVGAYAPVAHHCIVWHVDRLDGDPRSSNNGGGGGGGDGGGDGGDG